MPRVSEYLHYWLTEVIKPNRAPLTYVNYELCVRLCINPTLGNQRLDKLGVRDVQKWINVKDERRDEKRRRCCALSARLCYKDAPSPRTRHSCVPAGGAEPRPPRGAHQPERRRPGDAPDRAQAQANGVDQRRGPKVP
ncbi:N-terminal phage integrase SAM-like domain-containing protein [Amycolatopsis sp. NPDC049253]|uniref:N-terminal phage integrase SAM-like domain-containing protein n=1 Tax=Amycolatopsis sp. NPDC049253 TaxID=3155274 RepID=UPI00341E9F47